MKQFTNLFVCLGGGLLLWAAWPVSSFTLLIFIAWLPLLWLEDRINNWKKLFGLTYLMMLIWNVLVTWWVANASLPGALGAFLANSLIMCLPWLLMYFIKKRFGRWIGYCSLIVFWLTFEYIHHNWELSWPWLTLGNAFATHPSWIQWYTYTGTTGGSLWILVANIIAYHVITEYSFHGRTKKYYGRLGAWFLLILIPILISSVILKKEERRLAASMASASRNVVVVQPNVDPYKEKFSGSIDDQVQKLIRLSDKLIDEQTSLVVWPETAIPAQVWEDQIKENFFYNPVWTFLKRHPQISLVTGIDSYKNYGRDKKKATATSRMEKESGEYYDAFNTAALFKPDTSIQLYHKAKLVPGVESLPSFLNFMGKWFESFGGISGTLGRDHERKVFNDLGNYYKAAPIICYESIYSDYVTGYVRKGANLLTIITNDGWWGNTAGYRQHMNYGRMRAIETRKWVARSANTGISCFIDPLGNIHQPQPWDIISAIKMSIPVDDRITFFVKHGDILSRALVVVSIMLLALNLILWVSNRIRQRKPRK